MAGIGVPGCAKRNKVITWFTTYNLQDNVSFSSILYIESMSELSDISKPSKSTHPVPFLCDVFIFEFI